uniref:Uncharacterized protein n=1 Tax=Anguilla anguilla TaxID=7936 RepID=A0A0E9UF17_ANGAN
MRGVSYSGSLKTPYMNPPVWQVVHSWP